MDIKTLFNLARNVTNAAKRALEDRNYAAYPTYFKEYNKLLELTIEELGDEPKKLFTALNKKLETIPPGFAKPPQKWITYLETSYTKLSLLTTYLQDKLGSVDSKIQSLIDLIEAKLRPSIYEDPKNERYVQNIIETILRVRSIDYEREKISITYSSKKYIPDFTFDNLDLSLEVKICNSKSKEKSIIDEINADIPAYKSRYKRLIFVVFDLGFIRDVKQFKSGIENNEDVYVIVIKR